MPEINRDELMRLIQAMPSADVAETSDEVAERVAAGIASAASRRRKREAEMPRVAPRFDPVFNWGHVFTVLAIISGFGLAYVNYVAETNSIKAKLAESESRAAKYVPMIETAAKLNEVQDERIQNLAVAVADLRRASQDAATESRKSTSEIMGLLGTIREDMAQVKARLSIEGRGSR